jgi:hypothetical protein
MAKKLTDLITGVEQDLSQMAGRGVQIYSEQRIANYIQQAFELVFKEYYIPEYSTWETVTLDGVSGLPTSDMLINRFDDIARFFISGTEHELRRAPTSRNMNRLAGTSAIYVEPRFISDVTDFKRPFFCWPKTATDTLDIYGRVHPAADFAPTDWIMCDEQVIRLGACWLYAEDDGTNVGQIGKFKELFNRRIAQLQSANMQLPSPLDARVEPTLNEWAG